MGEVAEVAGLGEVMLDTAEPEMLEAAALVAMVSGAAVLAAAELEAAEPEAVILGTAELELAEIGWEVVGLGEAVVV